tara:strand:+ start:4592 stop:5335 length:744 start_codon:yes stop_codon:yes gene_type:complete
MVQKQHPTSLVVGAGEIGKGLYEVLHDAHGESVFIRDVEPKSGLPKHVDYLHITFPYSQRFEEYVNTYISFYNPSIVIIHSTVPIGTTSRISHPKTVHSPVRGKHPNLANSIRTFVKFIGGEKEVANKVAEYFINAKIKTIVFDKSQTTEMLKIISTTLYGWQIIACKEVARICDKYNLNFEEVYTVANKTYNEGYEELGMGHYRKPYLRPMEGKIGGHCVVPNCDLLEDVFTQLVKDFDKIYENEI